MGKPSTATYAAVYRSKPEEPIIRHESYGWVWRGKWYETLDPIRKTVATENGRIQRRTT